jgi:hypothetical protein
MELRLTKSSGICHVAQNTVNEEAKNLASFVSYLRKEDLGRLLFFSEARTEVIARNTSRGKETKRIQR